jgi:hypothetical protein
MMGTFAATSFAAEQTWTGKISDSICGAKHEEAAEGRLTQQCVPVWQALSVTHPRREKVPGRSILILPYDLVGRRIEGVAFPKNLPRFVDAPKHCVRVGARKIYGGIGFAVPKESVDSEKPGLP